MKTSGRDRRSRRKASQNRACYSPNAGSLHVFLLAAQTICFSTRPLRKVDKSARRRASRTDVRRRPSRIGLPGRRARRTSSPPGFRPSADLRPDMRRSRPTRRSRRRPRTPPPAKSEVITGPQWSRPESLLIRGVLPNSPVTSTSVSSNRPSRLRSSNSAERHWSR